MKGWYQLRGRFEGYLTREVNSYGSDLFRKALLGFLLIKTALLWHVLHDVVKYSPYEWNSLWRSVTSLPIGLAQWNLDVFLSIVLLSCVAGLFMRANFFLTFLIAWLSVCLSRMIGGMANGSDTILNLFLFLCLGFSVGPDILLKRLSGAAPMIHNFTWLLCRVQLALIYLISGVDKLFSETWRSGEAINLITNLNYFWNPGFGWSSNQFTGIVLAWTVIVFEIGFACLIWVEAFRRPLLIMGIAFHLIIIFFLSLPDFGLIMIVCYGLFLGPHPCLSAGRPELSPEVRES